MPKGTYTYDPGQIGETGKDRMRFELGDVMIEGGADTTALTDEEIQAALDSYPKSYRRAKLMLLESLCRRFAYEVDSKTGPLWLYMQARAKIWREDYEKLKKEVSAEACIPSLGGGGGGGCNKPPYFYAGMQRNERAEGRW